MKLAALVGLVLVAFHPQQAAPVKADPMQIEGFTEIARISVDADRALMLEPGIRAIQTDGGYSLSTYDGAKIRITTASDSLSLRSGTVAKLTPAGWNINGRIFAADSVTAGRDVQDDTDSNLKSMQENAKKLKSKNPPTNNNNPNQPNNNNQGNPVKHWRLLFSENPMPTAELFNSAAIQQLAHLSPNGF